MKTPDKIYRRLKGSYIYYSDFKPAKIRYNEPDAEEYIRKGALLKWAKEKKKWYEGREDYEMAFRLVIDKINSL